MYIRKKKALDPGFTYGSMERSNEPLFFSTNGLTRKGRLPFSKRLRGLSTKVKLKKRKLIEIVTC